MTTTQLPSAPPASPWGPTVSGGRRHRWLRRVAIVAAVMLGATMVGGVTTGALLLRSAERNLTRVPVTNLEAIAMDDARNYLVVGSDSRAELTAEERRGLTLGSDGGGNRSDTVMLVSLTADREDVNVVSFPRDLLVDDDGTLRKLTETFNDGPDNLIQVIRDNFGLEVHHYIEVSIGGFVEVVETVGTVRICLDEPLRDERSGADLAAGCHRLSPGEALSYVRSRSGARGDFKRIERQQAFIRAMLDEIASSAVLTDLPRLFRIVEDVAASVTTDEALSLNQMRVLAQEARELVEDDIPMVNVPGYTTSLITDPSLGAQSYVIAYEPGARAIFERIREGEPLPPTGTPEEREAVDVEVWSGGRVEGAEIVVSTLSYGAFTPYGGGPGSIDAGEETTVYATPGAEEEAGWVATMLGAPLGSLPSDVEASPDAEVIVAVGDDAVGSDHDVVGSD